MRIGPAANVARLNVDEIVTALWSFAHANGLNTDVISERTAAAGVTIDGVLLKDKQVDVTDLPGVGTPALLAAVAGDAFSRFECRADGELSWGSGGGGADANLKRTGADKLKTDDSFLVAHTLGTLGKLEVSEVAPTQITADQNNYVIADKVCFWLETDGSDRTITGFAGGASGRFIVIGHTVGIGDLILAHSDGGSAVENRMYLPGAAALTLAGLDACILAYDDLTHVWRLIAKGVV